MLWLSSADKRRVYEKRKKMITPENERTLSELEALLFQLVHQGDQQCVIHPIKVTGKLERFLLKISGKWRGFVDNVKWDGTSEYSCCGGGVIAAAKPIFFVTSCWV